MSSGTNKLTRSDRVASLELPPNRWELALTTLRRSSLWVRISLCLAVALALWGITHGWSPPFEYRRGYIPKRNIVARQQFEVLDRFATEELRSRLRSDVIAYYTNDTKRLTSFLATLDASVFQVIGAESYEKADKDAFALFVKSPEEPIATPDEPKPDERSEQELFAEFRESLVGDPQLEDFKKAVARAFAEHMKKGLLDELAHEDLSRTNIWVHPPGDDSVKEIVDVDSVRIATATRDLEKRLTDELKVAQMAPENVELVARLCANWLRNRGIPETLTFTTSDEETTRKAINLVLDRVEDVMKTYSPGETLAKANAPLDRSHIELLSKEHKAAASTWTNWDAVSRTFSVLGMYAAMSVLCGAYIVYNEPRLLQDLRQFITLLALILLTVMAAWICAKDEWRAEAVPLTLFGMILCIAYHRELALLLSIAVSLVVVLSLGQSLGEMVILVASSAAAILLLDRVRSRTKLIYVGCAAGIVGGLTTIGVGTLIGQTFGSAAEPIRFVGTHLPQQFATHLVVGSVWYVFCSVLAGILMTGLLPFVEKAFLVQTDLSLLEWGDAAHPLLQELAQRAPGTYNHSINVASLTEKAADSIGANGLLCRVGAYFHDIGKMLKPGYFVENQGAEQNRHDSLVPAMSTLVIIAHVKDGADLARQHGLPQPMIDFIEQHHGTTLVEYFYRQAEKQRDKNPHVDSVDESSFRYPGPKPQTREAAVMMLADAVESASRTLADPSPARIEGLVRDLAMKRLMDGQFDECGLTLAELHRVEESLVGSLASMYHSRIKYPEQPQSA